MDEDIFELLKELDTKNVEVSGYKNNHYIRINLNKEDLKKFETQYLHFYINKVEELRKDKLELEKALDKACEYLEITDYICSCLERKYYKAIGQEVDDEEQDWNNKKSWKEILLKDDY